MNMVEVTDTRVSCRRPAGLRIGMGVAGGVFGVLCLALLAWIWPSPAALAQRSPADILSRPTPTVGVPLVGLCFPTIFFLYLAGPEDLILDTVRRTYRFRRGLPLLVDRALESRGQTTAGTVTDLRHGKGYSVRYTYRVGDRTFDGRASLSASAYEAVEFGSPITVSYLPAYPHTSTLVSAQTTRTAPLFLVYGGLLAGLVLWTTLSRRDDR